MLQLTIGMVLNEIHDEGLKEEYTRHLLFFIRVARLTPKELYIVDEIFISALWTHQPLQWDDQIQVFIESLRASGLRPDAYWDYLIGVL